MPCSSFCSMASMRALSASGSTVAVAPREAHLRGAAHRRQRAAGGDHRLRRDAVPEVGGPADHVLLDDRDLGAEAGGVGGRGVAGRAAADDHEAQRHVARLPIRPPGPVTGRDAAAATVGWSCPAASCPGRRMPSPTASIGAASSLGRRWSAARSSRRPADLLLRPTSAYAAVCSCLGKSCACGSLCCDGYTEFCCAIYGANGCPSGSLIGGWWKADGSSFCGGAGPLLHGLPQALRRRAGAAAAASAAARCNGTPVRVRQRALRPPQGRLHGVPLRQLQQPPRLHRPDPVPGRHLHRAVADRAHLLEPAPCAPTTTPGGHNRPCLQTRPADLPRGRRLGRHRQVRASGSTTTATAGGRSRQTAEPRPRRRRSPTACEPGDRPVVGDWNGDGRRQRRDLPQRGQWHLSNQLRRRRTYDQRSPSALQAGDIPVVGDWDGDGVDGVGIFRRGEWHLASEQHRRAPTVHRFTYGSEAGDIPVVGDWNGDGHRRRRHLPQGRCGTCRRHAPRRATVQPDHASAQPGDIPVVGDWHGPGRDSIGVYRPSERHAGTSGDTLDDGSPTSRSAGASRGWSDERRDGRHRRRPGASSSPCSGCSWSGLLRSHAEILRALHDLGVNLEDGAPAPADARTSPRSRHAPIRTAAGVPRPRSDGAARRRPPTSPATCPAAAPAAWRWSASSTPRCSRSCPRAAAPAARSGRPCGDPSGRASRTRPRGSSSSPTDPRRSRPPRWPTWPRPTSSRSCRTRRGTTTACRCRPTSCWSTVRPAGSSARARARPGTRWSTCSARPRPIATPSRRDRAPAGLRG